MTIISVPRADLELYWLAKWAYVGPDFDKPNHYKIEWIGISNPILPDIEAEQLATAVAGLSDELARVG
jgi:hypothetical protein